MESSIHTHQVHDGRFGDRTVFKIEVLGSDIKAAVTTQWNSLKTNKQLKVMLLKNKKCGGE